MPLKRSPFVRRKSIVAFVLATVCLVAASADVTPAAEGRIPLLSLAGPPYLIPQPGHYILTRDVSVAAGNVVVIQSTGVILDLGGHTLTGPSGGAGSVILVTAPRTGRGITIRNGSLVGGSQGVMATGERLPLRLEGLEISGSLAGIVSNAEQFDLLDCHLHDLTATAVPAFPAVSVDAYGGRIVGNVIENVPGNGLTISGFRAGEIRGNVIRNFASWVDFGAGLLYLAGFDPTNSGGAIIADNTVSGFPTAEDDGIRILGPNSLVIGNVAAQNGGAGIFVSALHTRLERNVVSANAGDGIAFGAGQQRAHLEGNQAQGNFGCGVNINGALGLVYRDNTLSNNFGGSLCGGTAVNAGGNYCNLALCP